MRRTNFISIYFLFVFPFNLLSQVRALPLAPALYVFGDSLLDDGNNNFLPTLAKVNYWPYGDDFPKGPTGRFTNGRNVADFLAEYLGLPYSPPYVSLQGPRSLTGINFASGSCGILQESGKLFGQCMSLKDQIDAFQRTIECNLPKMINEPTKISEHLAKSIYAISIGSNDYLCNYLDKLYDTNRRYRPKAFARLLIDNLSQLFERLYKLGARKVVMVEIGPVGCTPLISTRFPHTGDCHERSNQMVSFFNERLAPMLKNLTSSLPGSMFVLARANSIAYDAMKNPSKYGLTEGIKPCCASFLNITCLPLTIPCVNRKEHFFWDGCHPTESVYSLMASRFISDKSSCTPMTIQELVKM